MPHLKQPKKREPLWKEWDYTAQKKGVRHTVYSVNGDEFTGEWLDNKKDGKSTYNITKTTALLFLLGITCLSVDLKSIILL